MTLQLARKKPDYVEVQSLYVSILTEHFVINYFKILPFS